jgi:hypothetical protein
LTFSLSRLGGDDCTNPVGVSGLDQLAPLVGFVGDELAKLAGVIGIGSAARSANRTFMFGSPRPELIAALSLSMISIGLFLGAPIRYQSLAPFC